MDAADWSQRVTLKGIVMKEAKPRSLDRMLLSLLFLRLFLPSLILTLLVVGLIGLVRARSVETQQLLMARSLAHTIDRRLEHATQMLGTMARLAETSTPEEVAAYMQATQQGYRYFNALYQLDEGGTIIIMAPPDPRYQDLDMSQQLHFQQARPQAEVTISQPFISERTGLPATHIIWPLADGGMMIGEFNLEELQMAILTEDEEQYFIVGQSGILLAHSQQAWVARQDDAGHMEIVQRGQSGETTLFYITNGVPVIGGTAQVERTGWLVVAQIPLATAYSPYLWTLGVALVLTSAIWLGVALNIRRQWRRHIISPLARLSQGANALAAGDFAQGAALADIPATSAEISALAADFERMSQAIQARQAALRASEEKYRAILENIEEGYYEVDIAGNFTFFNAAMCKMLGYAEDELMGMNNRQYMDAENARKVFQTFNAVYRTGIPTQAFDWELVRKDGSKRIVETSVSLMKDATGEPVGFRGIVRDITERRQAEQERERLLEAEHEQRLLAETLAEQFEALRRVSLELTAELDLDVLLHSIVSQAIELLGGTGGGLDLYQLDQDALVWTVSVGTDLTPDEPPLHRGEGLAGKVWETGEPLIVDDYYQWPGRTPSLEGHPFTAVVGVPVRLGHEFLGVLEVFAEPPRTFSSADAELLNLFATQAAIAIRNARLYEETRSRADRLAVVNRIASAASATLDLDELLETVYEELTSIFQPDAFFIALYDEESDELDFRLLVDEGKREPPERQPLGTGLTSYVVARREPLLTRDLKREQDRLPTPRLWGTMKLPASWLGVPMKIGERVVGVICVQAYRPHAYGEEEQLLLSTIADQVAVTVENARLFAETQRVAQRMQALYETSRVLSSSLEEEPLIRAILEIAYRTLGCEYVSIATVDEEAKTISTRHGIWHGEFDLLPEWIQMAQYPLDHPDILADVYRTGRTEIIGEWDERFNREIWDKFGHERLLRIFMPLKMGDRVIGTVEVGYDKHEKGHIDSEEMQTLAAFMDQAAAALENAWLFKQEREQRELAEALAEAAAAISSSLQLDEVLDRVLAQAERIVAGNASNIMLVEGETARMVRWRGYEQMGTEILGIPVPITEYANLVRMMQSGEPAIVSDTAAEPDWVLWEGWEWARSCVSAPIQAGGATIGFLTVDGARPGQFSPADARRLKAFSSHAATALENARLFEETQQRIAELETLQHTSVQLTSSLDLSAVLDTIATSALTLVKASDCHIYLYDEVDETFTLGTALWENGRREAAVKALRRDGLTATVAREGHPIVINDAAHHPLYATPEAQKWGLHAIAGFPLKRAGRVLGVLNIAFLEPHIFSQDELRVLGLLADQAAIAVDNAQLYRQLRDYAEQLEQRVQERTAQLQAQYVRLEAILRSTTDGIIVTDVEGEILQANPVAQAWLTQTLSPESAARLRQEVQRLAQRAEERPEAMLELKGLDLELKAAPVMEEGAKELAAAVVAVHDVSHLKALDRMKTRFVTNVSHELRTPITTIKLYAALMQRRPDKWRQYLDPLTQEAEHQARLVEDILQISRIDAGRLEMKPRPVSLDRLTWEIVASHQLLAQERGLTLEHRPTGTATSASPAESPIALVDPHRMVQVLNNLIENAIRYTPRGGRIVVSTERAMAEGRMWATVAVADTGMGIPEDELPHVFERFFRGEKPRRMQISGSGLGLAIVQEIVQLHGGWVTVESQVDVGTVFTVWLPAAEEQAYQNPMTADGRS